MDIINIYKCFCDRQRLRILNLLREGSLCVCHIMEILNADQVKISKQLRYMKELGLVEAERQAQWMVYRLTDPEHPVLKENLKCLQDCSAEDDCFQVDGKRRKQLLARLSGAGCQAPKLKVEQLANK